MKQYIFFVSLLMLVLSSCSRIQPELTPTVLPTATISNLGIGSTMISDKDGALLVYVPAGEFTMGSDKSEQSDEKPEHRIYLNAFWIDETEITNARYVKCVAEGACKEPKNVRSYARLSYYGNTDFNNYPVIFVDWNMAKTYCEWAGLRLPTEAEWEKAARSTDGRTYPWGEEINCSLANYWGKEDGCIGDTTKVGSYSNGASVYGAFDMAGNVWEWVQDWYLENYYARSPISNPLGPDSGQRRVVRGGSWDDEDNVVRSSRRSWTTPVNGEYSAVDNIGFRCATSATP